jgi:hypothetical protein
MENIKQYVFDFVEGRVPSIDFVKRMEEDPEILDWVQSIVPPDRMYTKIVRDKNETYPFQNYTIATVPYDIRGIIDQTCYGRRKTSIGCRLNIHSTISECVLQAFPDKNLEKDESLHLTHKLLLSICPEYIGGSEVDDSGILEDIVGSIPRQLSQTQGKKWAKEEIRKRFHIKGHHYPHWSQEPEWPMNQGEPMEYIKTIRDNVEYQRHVFRDPKTGEERMVFDAH